MIKKRLIAKADPLELEGLRLEASLYEREPTPRGDGVKKTISFHRERERKPSRMQRHKELARLAFIEFKNDDALFLGMLVDRGLRGKDLGRNLFKYFLGYTQEHGMNFAGTGKIHKPLVALVLQREGLRPKSQTHLAEILPPELAPSEKTPAIRFLSHDPSDKNIVSSRPSGEPFYEVDQSLGEDALPVDAERVVALHTAYRPGEAGLTLPPQAQVAVV